MLADRRAECMHRIICTGIAAKNRLQRHLCKRTVLDVNEFHHHHLSSAHHRDLLAAAEAGRQVDLVRRLRRADRLRRRAGRLLHRARQIDYSIQ